MIVQDTVDATIVVGGDDYFLTDLTTDFSRYNEADMIEATVVPEVSGERPDEDEVVDLRINGRQLFRGFIHHIEYNEDGSYKLAVYNDIYGLKNEETYLAITEPTPISSVVETVCEDAGVDYSVDLVWYTDSVDGVAVDYNVGIVETGTGAAKVLDKLAEWSNSDWWFDNYNTLQFGSPESQLHELEYVTNPSPSSRLPPYRGVRVVGDNIVSRKGYEASNIPGFEGTSAEFGLLRKTEGACSIVTSDNEDSQVPAPCWEIVEGSAYNPVFTYKDKQIKTIEQSRKIGRKLIEELYKNVRGGTVVAVGTQRNNSAEIDALDVIQMPESMGGERYFVGSVNHRINATDGYKVEIECEGLVPGRYGVDPITVTQ